MSRPDAPEDVTRRDDIAGRLLALGRSVEEAKRENAQGWTIQADLAKMRGLLDQLTALDEKARSSA